MHIQTCRLIQRGWRVYVWTHTHIHTQLQVQLWGDSFLGGGELSYSLIIGISPRPYLEQFDSLNDTVVLCGCLSISSFSCTLTHTPFLSRSLQPYLCCHEIRFMMVEFWATADQTLNQQWETCTGPRQKNYNQCTSLMPVKLCSFSLTKMYPSEYLDNRYSAVIPSSRRNRQNRQIRWTHNISVERRPGCWPLVGTQAWKHPNN